MPQKLMSILNMKVMGLVVQQHLSNRNAWIEHGMKAQEMLKTPFRLWSLQGSYREAQALLTEKSNN